jgi:hypothetical protein
MFSVKSPYWFKNSPCSGQDRLFFSSKSSNRRLAVKVCNSECDNRSECLKFAVSEGITIGVWGGKTGPELARLVEHDAG